jgi:hypothetical protein
MHEIERNKEKKIKMVFIQDKGSYSLIHTCMPYKEHCHSGIGFTGLDSREKYSSKSGFFLKNQSKSLII